MKNILLITSVLLSMSMFMEARTSCKQFKDHAEAQRYFESQKKATSHLIEIRTVRHVNV